MKGKLFSLLTAITDKFNSGIRTKILIAFLIFLINLAYVLYMGFSFLRDNYNRSRQIEMTGRLKGTSQSIAKLILLADRGEDVREKVEKNITLFESILNSLIEGDPKQGIQPVPDDVREVFEEIYDNWENFKESASYALNNLTRRKAVGNPYFVYLGELSDQITEQISAGTSLLRQRSEGEFKSMIKFVYLVGLISLAIFAFIMILFNKGIINPLKKLTDLTAHIVKGNY
jgi:nitrate/nitrite-specific signal transduction histidine kinase